MGFEESGMRTGFLWVLSICKLLYVSKGDDLNLPFFSSVPGLYNLCKSHKIVHENIRVQTNVLLCLYDLDKQWIFASLRIIPILFERNIDAICRTKTPELLHPE